MRRVAVRFSSDYLFSKRKFLMRLMLSLVGVTQVTDSNLGSSKVDKQSLDMLT